MKKRQLNYKGYIADYDWARGEYLVLQKNKPGYIASVSNSREFHKFVDGLSSGHNPSSKWHKGRNEELRRLKNKYHSYGFSGKELEKIDERMDGRIDENMLAWNWSRVLGEPNPMTYIPTTPSNYIQVSASDINNLNPKKMKKKRTVKGYPLLAIAAIVGVILWINNEQNL